MKFWYLIGICFSLSTLSCKKKTYTARFQDAVITGYDYRKCMCCGGLIINFNNDTMMYPSEFKLLSNNPEYFGFTDSTRYPVFIRVITEPDKSRCPGSFLKVKRFELN